MLITYGSDFELFILDKSTREVVLPVDAGLPPATKEHPNYFQIQSKAPFTKIACREEPTYDFGYHQDNVCLEITTPVHHAMWPLLVDIRRAFIKASRCIGDKYILLPCDNYRISKKMLSTPEAQTFGCDPDYDAFSKNPQTTRKVPDLSEFLYRFAGMHIHIGYPNKEGVSPEPIPIVPFVQLTSMFLNLLFSPFDFQTKRKPYYGQPGLYRPKEYGVELRCLSSATIAGISLGNNGVGYEIAFAARMFSSLVQSMVADPNGWYDVYEQLNWKEVLSPERKFAIIGPLFKKTMQQVQAILSDTTKAIFVRDVIAKNVTVLRRHTALALCQKHLKLHDPNRDPELYGGAVDTDMPDVAFPAPGEGAVVMPRVHRRRRAQNAAQADRAQRDREE